MPPDGEVTLGELARSLVAMETRVNNQFAAVNRRLDNLEFVPRREFEIENQALKDDIRELKEDKQWTRRILVAAFLFPVLVAVILSWINNSPTVTR